MKEKRLIKKAIKGDSLSFEKLLIMYENQLYRTAFLYVKNHEDALDITQETAFKAFTSIHQLKNEDHFLTWITKILIRCSYKLLANKKDVSELEMDIPDPRKVLTIERIDIIEALNTLPLHYQSIIIQFYFHDFSLHTISEVTGFPENTVKTYLSRAKAELRKHLGGDYFDKQRISL